MTQAKPLIYRMFSLYSYDRDLFLALADLFAGDVVSEKAGLLNGKPLQAGTPCPAWISLGLGTEIQPPQRLSHFAWQQDFKKLPEPVRLAWLAKPPNSQLCRLTAGLWAFRPSVGSGDWTIGTLPQIITLLEALPIPEPYRPPISTSAESDPLDLSRLIIDLDI